MIEGIGADIEETSRFVSGNDAFIKKIFSQKEIDYCNNRTEPHISFAGKFCAKEAVIKASKNKISINEIEILNDETGKPYVYLNGNKQPDMHCSISHTKDYAAAFVVIEKKGKT